MTTERRWSYYFIDYRRRYINDRAWIGLALVAIGLGGIASDFPWWIGVPIATAGVALIVWGLRAGRDDR